MSADEPLLKVENLSVKFQTEEAVLTAVDGISFDIEYGEVFGIVGESGCGKSVTSLSIMQLLDQNGMIEADTIQYKGENLLEKSDREMGRIRGGEISMIFQDPMTSLNPVISVGEQIAEVVRHHGDTRERTGFWSEMRRKFLTGTAEDSQSWQRAVELLDIVGIPQPRERAKDYPHQLSGGMRQRVMIASALAGDPSLIIADEPTTALDVSIEAQILSELLDLCEQFDVSLMFITHDLGVIHEICDSTAVMYAGEIMERADNEELFENPTHPYTQGLLKSIPRITDDREWLDAIEGTVPDLIDKPSGCPFRNRCEYSFEICDRDLVEYPIEDAPENHMARCHLLNKYVERNERGHAVEVDDRALDAIQERRDELDRDQTAESTSIRSELEDSETRT